MSNVFKDFGEGCTLLSSESSFVPPAKPDEKAAYRNQYHQMFGNRPLPRVRYKGHILAERSF